MAERFSCFGGGVASGTDKTIVNVTNEAATPTHRASIYDIIVGSVATPGDQAAKFYLGRTSTVGTGGTAFTPNNLDPAGPAGECSAYVGPSSEPTYTSNKQLLVFSLNQRATFRWVASPGSEMLLTATVHNGAGLKTSSSTSTQAYESTILFME